MNKKAIALLTILLFPASTLGQQMHYFTMYFQAKVTEKTPYQRKYVVTDSEILTEDYKNDRLQLSAKISGTTDLREADDLLSYIRTLGQENKYKEVFKKLNGEFKFYHESGGPSNEMIFKKNTILHVQAWTEDGKAQLIAGTGKNNSSSPANNEDSYEEYKDSLMVAHYIIRRAKNDTIYLMVDKKAEPKEGMQNFYQNLVKVLRYPVVAQIVGKEARIFVGFVVDETGKLTEFIPKTKEGFGFEKRVIQKLEAFPSWNPAIYNGRNVKTRFVLPVAYKLVD